MMIPPPIPVPIVMPTTLRPPRAAPSHHSPTVAQFASLSSVAGKPRRDVMRSRSGKSRHPRFGATTTNPFSRSSGPGAPMPIPRKSFRVTPVSLIVSRITPSITPTIRSTTPSAPSSGCVATLRMPVVCVPSSLSAPAEIFVPPRSTPMMNFFFLIMHSV